MKHESIKLKRINAVINDTWQLADPWPIYEYTRYAKLRSTSTWQLYIVNTTTQLHPLVIVSPWRAQIAHVVFAWQIIPFALRFCTAGRRERACLWGDTVVGCWFLAQEGKKGGWDPHLEDEVRMLHASRDKLSGPTELQGDIASTDLTQLLTLTQLHNTKICLEYWNDIPTD